MYTTPDLGFLNKTESAQRSLHPLPNTLPFQGCRPPAWLDHAHNQCWSDVATHRSRTAVVCGGLGVELIPPAELWPL